MAVWIPASPVDQAPAAALTAGTPWSVRRARGPGARPALEVWENGDLADVIVATPVRSQLLRGARRTGRGGRALSIAWGRVPADGHPPRVTFASSPLRRRAAADVIEVEGLAWLAIAAGRFTTASLACPDRRERLRLRTARGAPLA
jgi:hypothetical protein